MSIADLCRDVRLSIRGLVADLPDEGRGIRVPACPAWTVRDLVGHLVGTAEDVLAEIPQFPLSEAQTSAEVLRWDAIPLTELLERWDDLAPAYERLAEEQKLMPALVDVVTHEHDIRGALDLPGDRDSPAVVQLAGFVLNAWRPPIPLRVRFDNDTAVTLGEWHDGGLELVSTPWNFVRWHSGRRSVRQAAAMQWSTPPPSSLLAGLGVFGLAAADVLE